MTFVFVILFCRVTVTAACNMDFSRFPLDTQTCTLELESCTSQIHNCTFKYGILTVYFSYTIRINPLMLMHSTHYLMCVDAYTDEDLMLYWKSGDESLSIDDKISLSQFLIQKFHTTSRLAFYSSTGTTYVIKESG